MERVHHPLLDGAGRGHEGLAGDLASEDSLAALVRGHTPKDVHLYGLEVEQGHEIIERARHRGSLA